MSEYKLYKAAAGDAKRDAMIQALMAVGGGGLGYLLTRYGLGLKGAGAGIAGAGIGAVAGAGAGAVMAGMGEEQRAEDIELRKKQLRAQINANRDVGEEVTGAALNPLDTESGPYADWAGNAGLLVGLIQGARKIPDAPGERAARIQDIKETRTNRLKSKAGDVDALFTVTKGKSPKVSLTPANEFKLKKLIGGKGVDQSKVGDIAEALAGSKEGLSALEQKIRGKKVALTTKALRSAGDVKISKLQELGGLGKALKVVAPIAIGRQGGRMLGQLWDAGTAKEGSYEFVDEEGNIKAK